MQVESKATHGAIADQTDVSNQSRHIFYHHSHTPPVFVHPPDQHGRGPRTSLFASGPDSEGFHAASEGTHFIPFSMRLPLRGGAKGAFTSPANPKGPAVRYVVVGSVKLVDPATGKRSIAHFYRPIVVLPYLNPGIVLAPSEETVEVVERRGLGWSLGGAKGSVELRIALGRSIWVAGQRVWCEVGVRNDSSKKVIFCRTRWYVLTLTCTDQDAHSRVVAKRANVHSR